MAHHDHPPLTDAIEQAARDASLDDVRVLAERILGVARTHAVALVLCSAVVLVPLSLAKSVMWTVLMAPARAVADTSSAASVVTTLLALAATVLANVMLHGLALPLAQSALTLQAGDLACGGAGDWQTAWRRMLARLPVLLGAVVSAGLLVAFGTVLFVVPGLIAALLLSFVAPVALFEGKSWLAALERSVRLVAADWVRVAVVFVGIAVATAVVRFVLGFGLSPLGFFGSLVDDLVLLVTVPLQAVAGVLLYVEAREREDGFDEDDLRVAVERGAP